MSAYINWKNWNKDEFGSIKTKKYYFRALLKKFCLDESANILEIGFGNGEFLSFIKELNIPIIGVEKEKRLVEIAKKSGFNVFDNIDLINSKFDTIVLFDVLEHIPQQELLIFLRKLASLLNNFGQIIIRVPNGSSPFGLNNQHGDPTHQTIFTESKLAFFSSQANLYVKYSCGDLYPIFNGSIAKIPSRALKKILREIIERIIRFIFSPLSKGVLSANAIYVLKKDI